MKCQRKLAILLPVLPLVVAFVCLVCRTERIVQQQQRDADLIRSVNQGNATRVQLLLAEGASPNAHKMNLPLPSLWERVVAMLHRKTFESAAGPPALVLACTGVDDGKPDLGLDVVRLLLQAGANPMMEDTNGMSPLIAAIGAESTQTVQALLEHGASAVRPTSTGVVPICMAVNEKKAAIVKLLLAHGADPNSLDEVPILTAAAGNGDVDTIKVLLDYGANAKYYDPNAGTADGNDYSARFAASHELMNDRNIAENTEILRLLKQHGAK